MNASLFTLGYEGLTTREIAEQLMQSLEIPT
jgi:hypothetical protein